MKKYYTPIVNIFLNSIKDIVRTSGTDGEIELPGDNFDNNFEEKYI